ncbi:MAG TPA: acyl-CoA dehydrogenase family protein, partial [Acidimicrobiales bacterium]|nr:acyl-CoA dehydrogenase family protein [Acidimicrobiales bacterium]
VTAAVLFADCHKGGENMATDRELADEIVGTIKAWIDHDVVPSVSQFEAADEFPQAMFEQMCEFGLFGATIPEEYGGLGLDVTTYTRIIEELSRGYMSLAGILNTHKIAATMIGRFGTDEQRQRFLPRMCDGSFRAAFSLSEPDAGSDTGAIRCRAERDGDEWVVNGTKMWVTNGMRSSLVMLLARTPDDRITCFIVEKDPGGSFEGITVSKKIDKLGYRGLETVEMSYVDHRVPHANLLGGDDGLGHGRGYALSALELGRINVAARAVGVAQAAFEAAIAYAQQRETFGRPIIQHQAISFMLAEMATKLQAARLLTYDAARLADNGERVDVEAGMAKLFASEAAFEIATDAMRIHGGVGYTTEFPVERYFRDTPLMIIGEGTSEIQKMVIARNLVDRYPVE